MVRAAVVIAALLASASAHAATDAPPPWELDWPAAEMFWAGTTPGQSRYYVLKSEVARLGEVGGVDLWLHGEHSRDRSVTYRTSLWKYHLTCYGGARLLALTQYDAKGVPVQNWDGRGQEQAIRPGTMLDSVAKAVCE